MSEVIRCFLAISVEAETRIQQFLSDWTQLGPAFKVVSPAQLHITLKFFGDVSLSQVKQIVRQVDIVKDRHSHFEIEIKGLGVFPHYKRPTVLWAGIVPETEIRSCAEDLAASMEVIGFAKERSFHPHLTLARIKKKPPEDFQEWFKLYETTDWQTVAVSSMELFQSELTSKGPIYRILESFPLVESN